MLTTAVLVAVLIGLVMARPANAVTPSYIQAEAMDRSSTNSSIFSDGTASGGKALMLHKNGTVSKRFDGAVNAVVVRARGDQCAGAPRMIVRTDGVQRLSASVSSSNWTQYTASVSPAAGSHTLAISFTNDYASSSCNRNLRVDISYMRTPNPVALGAYIRGDVGETPAPWDPAKIDQFASTTGTRPKIVMWFENWSDTGFSAERMNAAATRGAVPMVTWNSWDPRLGKDQPKYALKTIARGDHDAYVRKWARDAAAYGKPVYLRFDHEMNGTWYPWSPGVNGNTSGEYVSAWRHVRDVFRQEGATNVRWVWSPNVAYGASTPFTEVYPGDAYVDWVALDGYNSGTSQPWSKWQSLTDVFGPSHDALAKMTSKPMMIAETASADAGGDKAAWMRQGLMRDLPTRLPRVRAVVWFHSNKETDWRVNSSSAALAAYKEVAASSLYQGRLP